MPWYSLSLQNKIGGTPVSLGTLVSKRQPLLRQGKRRSRPVAATELSHDLRGDRWGASAPHTPSAFGLAPLACLQHVLTQPENPGPRGLNLDALKCSKKDNVWAVSTVVCLGQWLSTRNDSVGSGAIFGCHYGDAATSIQWVEARGAAREPTTETRPARNLSGTKAEKCSRVTTRAEMVTPALSALCAQLLNRAWPTADTQPTSAACVSRTLATHISRQTLRHGQRRSRSSPKTHSSAQSEK